jgi:peptidyl-prolyl cis-trans isomerase D
MAIISSIRKYSWIAVALIGIAMLGFILQDGLQKGSSWFGSGVPNLAKINGEGVKFNEFDDMVNVAVTNYKQRSGVTSLTSDETNQLRDMVWNQLLNQKLLGKVCANLGLSVTDDELNDMLYGKNIHPYIQQIFSNPQTGEFDPAQVQQTFDNMESLSIEQQKSLKELVKELKQDKISAKYQNLVAVDVMFPDFYVDYTAKLASDSVSMNYAFLSFTSISDTLSLTDADYKAYFKENKAMLVKDNETRAVDFVTFDVIPSEQDLADIEKQVSDIYSELLQLKENIVVFADSYSSESADTSFKRKEQLAAPWNELLFNASTGQIFEPQIVNNRYEMAKVLHIENRSDSMSASHILITSSETALARQLNVVRSKDDAKRIADSIKNVAKANPFLFAELAKNFSDDPGTKDNGGEIGWFTDGAMIPEFNSACLNGKVGDVVVVETAYGYHVIRIEDKTAPVKKVSVAFIYIPIEASDKTNKSIYSKANQFFAQVKTNEELKNLAQENGLILRNDDYLQAMAQTINGLTDARTIVHWAFNKKTKVGTVAPEIYELSNQYIIVSLRNISAKGDMTLADMKAQPQIQYAVRNFKKALLLKKQVEDVKATSLTDYIAIGATVSEYPSKFAFNSYGFDNKPYEPDVVGAAFGVSGMSKALRGRSGIFVLADVKREDVEVTETTRANTKTRLESAYLNSIRQQFINTIIGHADLEDNRALYY